MENKNPIFSIKNFRSFGEEGVDFELAPITVLTGCNSAGKSSLVKAILLLSKQPEEKENTTINCARGHDQFRKEMCLEERTSCPSTTLVLPTSLSLGRFDKLLNDKTNSQEMEISYIIWSFYLHEMIRVRRVFKAREGDLVNFGELVSYSVEKLDKTIICKYTKKWIDGISFHEYETLNFDAIDEKYRQFRKTFECNGIDDIDDIIEELAIKVKKEKRHREKIVKWNSTVGHLAKIVKNYSERVIDVDETLKYAFSSLINNEVVRPSFIKNVAYCDSSSAYIKRIYSIEDDNKLSKALRWLNEEMVKEKQDPYDWDFGHISMGQFVNKWIKKFEIGEKIELVSNHEGLGVMVYLIKNGEKRLLADEGYGITQLVTLLLFVENRMTHYDGYDVEPEPSYICVEEPENHLHPKFQSLLADMFVEAYQKYNIHFIIETHSEYLIRKLQVMVADKEIKLSPNDVSINYVEKNEDGISYNRQIKIKEDGRLHGSFGTGFYDEAGGLSRRLFMLND